MRQREYVGAQVDAARDESRLCGRLEISREQHASRPGSDSHGERAVVARAAARLDGRPQGLDPEIARVQRRSPRALLPDLHSARQRRGAHGIEARIVARAKRKPEHADGDAGQHRGNPAAMIEICVGDDEQIEAPDAEGRERGHHHAAPEIDSIRCRKPGIDEHGAKSSLHEQRVALPDVEGDEPR